MLNLKDNELPPMLIDNDNDFKLYTRCLHKQEYVGENYDPEGHIAISTSLEKCLWKITDIDSDFALYLNYPIYKRDDLNIIEEYFENTLDDIDLSSYNHVNYYKTLFDLSTPDNYIKLVNPIPSKYDGFVNIKKRNEE